MSQNSNRLPVLAAEVRRAHGDAREAAKTAADRAIAAGHALMEAKALARHGEWLPWLKEYCGVSERSAQQYMQIARFDLKPETVADLGGIRAAVAFLATHKLPGPGEVLFVFLANEPLAIVTRDRVETGHFRVGFFVDDHNAVDSTAVTERGVWLIIHNRVGPQLPKLSFELIPDTAQWAEGGAA